MCLFFKSLLEKYKYAGRYDTRIGRKNIFIKSLKLMNLRLDWDDGRKGKVAFRSRELFVRRVFRKREKPLVKKCKIHNRIYSEIARY